MRPTPLAAALSCAGWSAGQLKRNLGKWMADLSPADVDIMCLMCRLIGEAADASHASYWVSIL